MFATNHKLEILRAMQVFQQLSTQVASCLIATNKASLLYCIRLLPANLHAVALEAKHSEVSSANSLVLHGAGPPSAAVCAAERAHVLCAMGSLPTIEKLAINAHWLCETNGSLEDILYASFTSLTRLSHLRLCDAWTQSALSALSRALSSLTALRELHIDGTNNVSPSKPCGTNLQQINTLAISLGQLPGLKVLALRNFKPDCAQVGEVCCALRQLTTLAGLSLFGSFRERRKVPRGDGMRVAQHVAGMLQELTLLDHLNLSSCFPPESSRSGAGEYVEPVLDAIASLTQLSHLSLGSVNCFGDNTRQSSLSVSHLHQSDLAPENIRFRERLAPMLSRLSKLQSLNLTNFPVWEETQSVAKCFSILTHLTALTIDGLQVEEYVFWSILAPHISALVNLRFLGMSAAFRSLPECHELLDQVAENVARLPQLSSWRLQKCCIKENDAAVLSRHLVSMTALTALDLSNNDTGLQGAQAIAKSLASMPQIRELKFSGYLVELGKSAIRQGLEVCHGPSWKEVVCCHFLSFKEMQQALV